MLLKKGCNLPVIFPATLVCVLFYTTIPTSFDNIICYTGIVLTSHINSYTFSVVCAQLLVGCYWNGIDIKFYDSFSYSWAQCNIIIVKSTIIV